MVPGGRPRGEKRHDKITQGRGGEELATPRSRGRQEQRQSQTGGRGGSRTGTAVDEFRSKTVDRLARYRLH